MGLEPIWLDLQSKTLPIMLFNLNILSSFNMFFLSKYFWFIINTSKKKGLVARIISSLKLFTMLILYLQFLYWLYLRHSTWYKCAFFKRSYLLIKNVTMLKSSTNFPCDFVYLSIKLKIVTRNKAICHFNICYSLYVM